MASRRSPNAKKATDPLFPFYNQIYLYFDGWVIPIRLLCYKKEKKKGVHLSSFWYGFVDVLLKTRIYSTAKLHELADDRQ